MKTLILLQDMTNISVEGREIPKIDKLRNVNICQNNPTTRKKKNF
jgi:hypothetical protein